MRKYLFSTGLIGVISSTLAMLRAGRGEPITWRTVLAWLSWGISVAYVVGSINELRREEQGRPRIEESDAEKKAHKQLAKHLAK